MRLKAALFFIATAIGFHIYLALHYYELNFGLFTGESFCNINAVFNCDTVTASKFSSVFGIPIALWGAVTNSVLLVLLMGWILGWANDLTRHSRFTLYLSGLIATVSIVMGAISTFAISSYCLFCIGTYIASFIAFILIYKSQEPNSTSSFKFISELAYKGKSYLYFLIAIPVATLFFHYSYTSKVGGAELEKHVRLSVADWKAMPAVDLSVAAPSFLKGPENAKMSITEFADFRCGHCKQASSSIKAFIRSHSGVNLKFYTFPLDGACNDSMQGGGDGVSCYLAKSVFCSEKINQKGELMHDAIFSAQEKINQSGIDYAKNYVAESLNQFGTSIETHNACIENSETDTAIRNQIKAAVAAGIKGTPFFLVNGKRLDRGQLIPVLEAVYGEL